MRTDVTCSPGGCWKWVTGLLLASAMMSAQAGEVTFDFEEDPLEASVQIFTSPDYEVWSAFTPFEGLGNPDEFLILTPAAGSHTAKLIFPDIDDGALVKAFTLTADIRTGNGTTPRPADGFSISYARADDPILEEGPGNYAPPGPAEAGARTGVVVTFDTWAGNSLQDGSPDYEGVYVHVDGVPVGGVRLNTRHGDCDDPDSLQTGPRTDNSADVQDEYGLGAVGGNPNSLCWQPLEVSMDENGVLNVKYKGNSVLEDFQTSYFPSAGQVVVAGRTGGANEIKHIDNLTLRTELADKALLADFSATANSFTVSFQDVGDSRIDENTVMLTLDGEAVTPGSVTKEGNITSVSYVHDGLWPGGSEHTVGVSATLSDGSTLTKEVPFTVMAYTLVGADLKLDGPFTERGFLMRVFQPQDGIGLVTNTFLHERHIAGDLEDGDGNPLENVVDYEGTGHEADDNGFVEVDGYINFAIDNEFGGPDETPQGVFREGGTGGIAATDVPDEAPIPGIPGDREAGQTDSITAEILAVVEVPAAGTYRWAFNSDDGFRTTAGANTTDLFDAIELGGYNGGRGASTTLYTVGFEEPGFYRIRHIWYEGGGGANLEWWLADMDGNPVALFNDDDNGGFPIYRDNIAPDNDSVVSITPGVNAVNVSPVGATGLVVNSADAMDDGSVSMTLNGVSVTPNVDRRGDNTRITYTPTNLAPANSVQNVIVNYSIGGTAYTRSWQYTIVDYPSLDCATGTALGSGSNRGFNYFTFQGGGGIGNVITAENRLQSDGDNGADPASGSFEGVVNFQQDANLTQGRFNDGNGYPDDFLPGIGQDGGKDQIAIEFTAYLEFPTAGYYRMGVNSDDGFKVSNAEAGDRGPEDSTNALDDALGFFNAGRGTGETAFGFGVPVAGVYPMRLVWYEGGGGADVEWYSILPDDTRVLINDDDGLPAYQMRAEGPALDCPVVGGAISVAKDGDGNVVITYEATLQSSATVDGTYEPVAGAVSPYTVPATGAARFYIAR